MMSAAMPRLTIVLGMHRSGTSLCSHVLSLLGLDMADEISPHESNAKGHWERWEIVGFHDRVLRHFGQDYFDLRHALPLPPGWWAEPAVRLIRDEIVAWLRPRIANSRRVGLKDPRISRLLPMWWEILSDLAVEPRFVVCVRHPDAVAGSLAARDTLDLAEGRFRWLTYNADLIDGLGRAPVTIVPYDRWFSDFDANLAALAKLAPAAEPLRPGVLAAIGATVDPALRRNGVASANAPDPNSPEPNSPDSGAELYRLLLNCVDSGHFSSELRTAAAILDRLSRQTRPIREEFARQSKAVADLKAEAAALAEALGAVQARLDQANAALDTQRQEVARLTAPPEVHAGVPADHEEQ
jgi:uncharacterized protein YukE